MESSLILDGYNKAVRGLLDTPIYYIILELFIAALFVWILFKKSDKKPVLSFEEEERKVQEYCPDDLVPLVDSNHPRLKVKIIGGKAGRVIQVDGKECINFATHNYLGLLGLKTIEDRAVASVRKYGVGSCGPRGFYGTVDVHLELEEIIAKFFNQEEAVVYSYGFSTIASAIPAYSKRTDVIFVDENVNFSIQKGLDASRSVIKYFKHNNMEDLERILDQQAEEDAKNRKKAQKTRRFLIVEGVYRNSGDMCPLPKLVELKNKHKVRIFVDESISFGSIGKTGRGVTEHFGIPIEEIDLIMAGLECAIGSVGGFCVGSSFIIEHQRLSGLGYCFSASLPPLLTVAAIEAIKEISVRPEMVSDLQEIASYCHESLISNDKVTSTFSISSHPLSPVKHLVPKNSATDIDQVMQMCYNEGIAIDVSSYLDIDKFKGSNSLIISVNCNITNEDIDTLVKVFNKVLDNI